VIAMYLEGLQRADKFIETVKKISQKKPVVALYVGGTETGARSAATHTSAMTISDNVVDAAFRQSGVIRAYSFEELIDYSWALAEQPLPAGDRMAVVTVSGGPGSSMADSISRCGLKLPEFTGSLRAEIERHLPHTGASINPVDITYSMNPDAFTRIIPEIVLKSDEIDGLFIYGLMSFDWFFKFNDITQGAMGDVDAGKFLANLFNRIEESIDYLMSFNKPILASTFQSPSDSLIRNLRLKGFPIYPSPERAVKAMSVMYQYKRYRDANS